MYLLIPQVRCIGTKLMYIRLIDLRDKDRQWVNDQAACVGYLPGRILVKFSKNISDANKFFNENAKPLIADLSNDIKLKLLLSSISKKDLENSETSFFKIEGYLRSVNTAIITIPFNVENEVISLLKGFDGIESASINPIVRGDI